MPCYSYSSNQPVYLEPSPNPWSIEIEYNVGATYSYAAIARLCEIEAKDQLCVYTKTGAVETLVVPSNYTVHTGPLAADEYITFAVGFSLTGVDKVIIRRCTPNNKMLISFAEGAKLSAKQLNLVTHQLLFIAQEKQFKDANITHIYPLATSYGTPAAWNPGTVYGLNAYVVFNSIVYQSLQAGNTGKNPGTETTWWAPIEFLTKGFVVQNSTSQPVVFDFSNITFGQGLMWNGSKFIPGNPSVDITLADGSITNSKLKSTGSDEAVNTNVIKTSAITEPKIATGAVTPAKLSTGGPSWTSNGVLTTTGLTVTGISALTGAVTCGSGLTISNGNLALTTGNASITGALTVTGATTVQNLTVQGTFTTSAPQTYPTVVFVEFLGVATYGPLGTNLTNPIVLAALTANITTKRNSSDGSRVKITAMISYETHNNGAFVLQRKQASGQTWNNIGFPSNFGARYGGIAPFDYDNDNASTMAQSTIVWLDNPGPIGEYQYRIVVWSDNPGSIAINRTLVDTDGAGYERAVSCVLLEEIWT